MSLLSSEIDATYGNFVKEVTPLFPAYPHLSYLVSRARGMRLSPCLPEEFLYGRFTEVRSDRYLSFHLFAALYSCRFFFFLARLSSVNAGVG